MLIYNLMYSKINSIKVKFRMFEKKINHEKNSTFHTRYYTNEFYWCTKFSCYGR
jgi:hypothetical protein